MPASAVRHVRVFISSTFRDMQEERDNLIKKIFPQLRKLCEARAVTWTEVDLRWGITTEQAAEGKVLPLCLEEIHRCRPYFIGLLGERYGWVPEPDSISADLLESQPWLQHHLQHSITELEILHGVFREEPMRGHAYFYFRDPRYLANIPSGRRQDFTAESADAAGKLEKLKQRIRGTRDEQACELRENYTNPEQLGEWILEDFKKLIDRLYPQDRTPDVLDQEASRHEAYARSRRLAFVGREDLLRRLTEHCTLPGKPLVITGESGCGKSALLAEWTVRWRADHPDDLTIQHYIGSTPDSADWRGLVRRILGELKRAFNISDEIPPMQPDDPLRSALSEWTAKAVGSRRVVLVIDAVNQLAADGMAWQLGWLPVEFPFNFRVLVSTLSGESLDAMKRRAWPELNIPPFAEADIAPATLTYFKIFSKTPSRELLAKLESTPAARNALYLRAVLDELRQFGKYEELEAKAADYLSASGPKELYERILERWTQDFGENIAKRGLSLIGCAHQGLSETTLLELLGTESQPIPRAVWTPFYLAVENALTQQAGLLNFAHEYLRAAVREFWMIDHEAVRSLHRALAIYFSSPNIAASQDQCCAELPHQLHGAEEFEVLRVLLLNGQEFPAYVDGDNEDEIRSWSYIGLERGETPPGSWFKVVAVDPGEIDWACRRCHHDGIAGKSHNHLPEHCPSCGFCGDPVLRELFGKIVGPRPRSQTPAELFKSIRQALLARNRPRSQRADVERELAERKAKAVEDAERVKEATEAVRVTEELAERDCQEVERYYAKARQRGESPQGPPGGWFAVLRGVRGGHDVYCRRCGSIDADPGSPPETCPNCGWQGSKVAPEVNRATSARAQADQQQYEAIERDRRQVERAYQAAIEAGAEPPTPPGNWYSGYGPSRYGHSLYCRRCGGVEEDEGPPPEKCPQCGWE